MKFFTKKYYWGALVNSFKVTVVSTLVASLIGVPMAYLLRSVKIRGAGLINILIVISYLSPPFIGAYSWIQLLGPERLYHPHHKRPLRCEAAGHLRLCRYRARLFLSSPSR